MILFFCISYLSIPSVLMLISKSKNKKVFLASDQESVHEFFRQILPEDQIILIPTFRLMGYNNFFKSLVFNNRYKKNLSCKFEKFSNAEIYFFYNAFGFNISWLLKKLSVKNTIYYKPDIDISNWVLNKSFFAYLNKIKIFLFYGIKTDPLWTGERLIYAVSDNFLKLIKAKRIDVDVESQIIKNTLINYSIFEKVEVLYLTGGLIESGIIENDEFIEKSDIIIDNLIKIYDVKLKMHPRFSSLYSKETLIPNLPRFIPANLLIYLTEIVIGYSTSTLFEAANNNLLSISLLDFYKPLSTERRNSYKEYLQKNLKQDAKIYFPKEINELLSIINNHVKK